MIGTATNVSLQVSSRVHRNVKEILDLHEEILSRIRGIVSNSETRSEQQDESHFQGNKHDHWHYPGNPLPSSRTGTTHFARRSFETSWFGRLKRGVLISDPGEVAGVAKVFDHLVRIFLDPL